MLATLGAIHEIAVLSTIHCGKLYGFPYAYLDFIACIDLVLLAIHMANCVYRSVLSHLSVDTVFRTETNYW